ncbi:MAG: DUF922 domain-containing protein [Pseudomonadota bacterium]
MKRLPIALVCGLMMGGPALASDLTDPLTVEYYSVGGATLQEIRAQIKTLGPRGDDGKVWDGYTRWNVRWTYNFVSEGRICKVKSFTTTLKVVMTLPKWNKPPDAPPRLVGQWDRYIAALTLHEDGHYDFAVAATEKIKRMIAGKSSAASCAELGREINAEGNAISGQYVKKNAHYDADSTHGKTQGVIF